MVVAVEHADGTAATVQLAYGAGHRFYSGWGSEAERLAQTRWAALLKWVVAATSRGASAPATAHAVHRLPFQAAGHLEHW